MKIHNGLNACIQECHRFENLPQRPRCLHGASILGKKGRVITSGYNHLRNQCSQRNPCLPSGATFTCSFHAELDVLMRFFNKSKFKHKEGRKCLQDV
jgi:hypothetical protein